MLTQRGGRAITEKFDLICFCDRTAFGSSGRKKLVPGASAFMVYDEAGNLLHQEAKIHFRTHGGQAEFEAVAAALRKARELCPGGRVKICSDDEQVVGLLSGQFPVRRRHAKLYRWMEIMCKGLNVTLVQIYRSENTQAHRLRREALSKHLKAQRRRRAECEARAGQDFLHGGRHQDSCWTVGRRVPLR